MNKTALQYHVYTGYIFILVAALHNNFEFGWNFGTFTQLLVAITILSGIFGIYAGVFLDKLLDESLFLAKTKETYILINKIDDSLLVKVDSLPEELVRVIRDSVKSTSKEIIEIIDASIWGLSFCKKTRSCSTQTALTIFEKYNDDYDYSRNRLSDIKKTLELLADKVELLNQLKVFVNIHYLLNGWKLVHSQLVIGSLSLVCIYIFQRYFI